MHLRWHYMAVRPFPSYFKVIPRDGYQVISLRLSNIFWGQTAISRALVMIASNDDVCLKK